MSDNWVVQNLQNALKTWNEKLAEIWTLVTQSPQNNTEEEKAETESLINPADRPVAIGDTYSNGKFYRGEMEILTPLEDALKTNAEYEAALREIETALGVNNA